MGENPGDPQEKPEPDLPPSDWYWGHSAKNTLGDVKEELEPLAGSERGEPISNPSENLESNEDNGEPGINILNLIIIFMVVVIGLASVPSLRMIGVVVGVIAGVYFGATWVWKAIIKQEVRLFSVESGFYWLILCIGGAFVVFLVSYSGTP